MEQKRTLWIIVAAGVFLLVVLGAACVLYSPAKGANPPSIAHAAPSQSSGTGWTSASNANLVSAPTPTPTPAPEQETISVPSAVQTPTRTNELTVISENTVVYDLNKNNASNGTTIDLNALRIAQETKESAPQNINITVNVPEKQEPPRKVEPQPVAPAPAPKAPVPPTEEPKTVKVAKQETPKPAPKAATAPAPEKKVAPAPAKKSEPAVAKVAEKKADQYWVQAAAYSTKKTAENARSVLDDNKIPADIFTYKDAKGKVFYRVRVGPYTTKSEAEYWRTRIVKINEFADGGSYITLN